MSNAERIARALAAALDVLEPLGIPYCLIGGVAAALLGEPRPTKDVDLLVAADSGSARPLLDRARTAGFQFDRADAELQIEMGGVVRLPYRLADGTDVLVDLIFAETPYDQGAVARARSVRLFQRETRLVTPEDLLVLKLLASRPQDLADIDKVLLRQGPRLDRTYLRAAIRQVASLAHRPDLAERLEQLLATRP